MDYDLFTEKFQLSSSYLHVTDLSLFGAVYQVAYPIRNRVNKKFRRSWIRLPMSQKAPSQEVGQLQ